MNLERQVACYGVLRNFTAEGALTIAVPDEATALEVKAAILQAIKERHPDFQRSALILEHSVLANDTQIFSDDASLQAADWHSLALLPPVNGG